MTTMDDKKIVTPEKEEESGEEENISKKSELELENEEDQDEDIVDLDEVHGDEPELSQKNIEQGENTITKDNLNTQLTTNGENPENNGKRVSPLNLNFRTIDFNTVPKDEIVDFLLNNKEMFYSDSNPNINKYFTKKHRKLKKDKYINIESSFKQTKAKPNYFLLNSSNNPEKTYDFDTARSRVIKKAIDEKNVDEHVKLLVTKKGAKKTKNVKNLKFKSAKSIN